MPGIPPLRYIGSFQRGAYLASDDPLEEVWSRVERFGASSYVKRMTQSAVPPAVAPWEDWGPYAVVRIRQATEFRRAAGLAGLLTRPLPLYYSFLNLLRGFLALEKQVIAKSSHGLHFEQGSDLLSSGARITNGTFTDYLAAHSLTLPPATTFSLEEAVSALPEVCEEFVSLGGGWTNAMTIRVEAYFDGQVLLNFKYPPSEQEFRDSWETWFPSLATTCCLEPAGTALRVLGRIDTSTDQAIASYLSEHLLVNLQWSDAPLWYIIRRTDPKFTVPRPAYYFLALYILGNVVRYQPELLLQATDPDSDTGWFVTRVLNSAERYFPQLMLHWLVQQPLFF